MNQVDKVLEDETIEVEYLLKEPPKDQVSVDCALHFDHNILKIEDSFCISDSKDTKKGEDIPKGKVLDFMPFEVEAGSFYFANGKSNACEDYLLDVFAENVTNLDLGPSKLHLANSISQNQISILDSANDGSLDLLDFSTAITRLPECDNAMLNTVNYEFNGISNFACTFESFSKDVVASPSSIDLQTVHTFEDVSSFPYERITSGKDDIVNFSPDSGAILCDTTRKNGVENVGVIIESRVNSREMLCSPSVSVGQKRLRKPTRRYIDELSNSSSRYCRRKKEASPSTLGKRSSGLGYYKNHRIGARATRLFSDDSTAVAIQVPFASPVQKESQRRHLPSVKLEMGTSQPGSDGKCMMTGRSEKEGIRRKHHRPWTVSEVKKLLDGVSKYGVGKWSYIKKLWFSSSAHRTPVDLKDKWRNLLKASGVQRRGKGEDEEHKRNNAWRPLPKSMLRRVCELACMYPYPGPDGYKSKCLHASLISVSPKGLPSSN